MRQNLLQMAHHATQNISDAALDEVLSKLTIILSAPRSGSTLLFEQLAKPNEIWSIGNESHVIFSQFPHLKFENQNLDSGALNEAHADLKTIRLIKATLYFLLTNNTQQRYIDPQIGSKPNIPLIIEKTPRNALNIPFLLKIFPQAQFIYLFRDPRETIASLIEAWQVGLQTGRFATYPSLPGWHLPAWCFLLPRNWQKLIGKSLAEITCFQWCESNRIIKQELAMLNPKRIHQISFNDLVQNTNKTIRNTLKFIDSDINTDALNFALSRSKTTLSPPQPNKWRRHETEIMALAEQWQPIWQEIIKTAT